MPAPPGQSQQRRNGDCRRSDRGGIVAHLRCIVTVRCMRSGDLPAMRISGRPRSTSSGVRNVSMLAEWAIRRKEVRKASSLISGENAPLERSWRGHLPSVKELPLKGGVRRDVDRQDVRLGGGVARRFTRSEHRPTGKSTPIPRTRRSDLLSGHTGWPVAPQGTGTATMVDRTFGAGHTTHTRRAGAGDGPGLPPGWSGFRSERIGSIGTRLLNHTVEVSKRERWRPVEGC